MKNAFSKRRVSRHWSWSGASVRGTSHAKTGDPKQDFAAVAEYTSSEGAVIVVVVSDGAGSASRSDVGSRLACHSAHALVKEHFDKNSPITTIDKALAERWLSTIRQKLAEKALAMGIPLRELAATISIAIIGNESTVLIVVGDSPCVVHDTGTWLAPIWPMRGEYANQTFFATQDPIPIWGFLRIDRRIDKVAVFSDGIEKLVLKEKGRVVFQPFFDEIFKNLSNIGKMGRNRPYSDNIRNFLASDRVNSLTDDDKTLIVAARFGDAFGS